MNKNLACGIASLMISGSYVYAATQLPKSILSDSVGASGFPLLIGWSMVVLSVLLIGQTVLLPSRAVSAPDEADQEHAADEIWEHPKRTLIGAGVLTSIAVGYLILLPILGYLISMMLLLGATSSYISRALGPRQVGVAIGGAAALYILFVVVLGIPMPAGIFEGLL